MSDIKCEIIALEEECQSPEVQEIDRMFLKKNIQALEIRLVYLSLIVTNSPKAN
jgi:hypothetical protein